MSSSSQEHNCGLFCRNAFLKEGSSCYRVTAEKWYNFSNDFHALHIETGNDNCYDSMDSPFIYNNRKLEKKTLKTFFFQKYPFL